MKEYPKCICFIFCAILNVVWLYTLGFWKYMYEDGLFGADSNVVGMLLGIMLGIYAVLVLAFSETSILVQLYYRKKYSMFERKCFDNNMKIQVSLLVFYYVSSLIFCKTVSTKTFMMYLILIPILLAVGLTKMSRMVWEKEDIILFMDVNGQVEDIDKICVREDMIELICKSGDKKTFKNTKRIARLYVE